MNLATSVSLYAGGQGSGCNPAKGTCGRKPGSKAVKDISKLSEKAQRALAFYVPFNADKHKLADKAEATVAKILGGKQMPDHSAYDVIVKNKNIVIEVKSLQGKDRQGKLTIHSESRKVKAAYDKKHQPKRVFTVAVDYRKSKSNPTFYIKGGVGAFRIQAMMKVDKAQLKKVVFG